MGHWRSHGDALWCPRERRTIETSHRIPSFRSHPHPLPKASNKSMHNAQLHPHPSRILIWRTFLSGQPKPPLQITEQAARLLWPQRDSVIGSVYLLKVLKLCFLKQKGELCNQDFFCGSNGARLFGHGSVVGHIELGEGLLETPVCPTPSQSPRNKSGGSPWPVPTRHGVRPWAVKNGAPMAATTSAKAAVFFSGPSRVAAEPLVRLWGLGGGVGSPSLGTNADIPMRTRKKSFHNRRRHRTGEHNRRKITIYSGVFKLFDNKLKRIKNTCLTIQNVVQVRNVFW